MGARVGHDDINIHGVKEHESYRGDRTQASLSAFAENLVPSAGQPHHYIRWAALPLRGLRFPGFPGKTCMQYKHDSMIFNQPVCVLKCCILDSKTWFQWLVHAHITIGHPRRQVRCMISSCTWKLPQASDIGEDSACRLCGTERQGQRLHVGPTDQRLPGLPAPSHM